MNSVSIAVLGLVLTSCSHLEKPTATVASPYPAQREMAQQAPNMTQDGITNYVCAKDETEYVVKLYTIKDPSSLGFNLEAEVTKNLNGKAAGINRALVVDSESPSKKLVFDNKNEARSMVAKRRFLIPVSGSATDGLQEELVMWHGMLLAPGSKVYSCPNEKIFPTQLEKAFSVAVTARSLFEQKNFFFEKFLFKGQMMKGGGSYSVIEKYAGKGLMCSFTQSTVRKSDLKNITKIQIKQSYLSSPDETPSPGDNFYVEVFTAVNDQTVPAGTATLSCFTRSPDISNFGAATNFTQVFGEYFKPL